MKTFLETALNNKAPLLLRNGLKAYIVYNEKDLKTQFPLIGYIESENGIIDAQQWSVMGESGINVNGSYENIPELDIVDLYKENVSFLLWHVFKDDINYIFKQANGGWCCSVDKPKLDCWDAYWDANRMFIMSYLDKSLFPDVHWLNSVIKRPR